MPAHMTHVLVIDDEASIRGFIRTFLTVNGCRVTEAANGGEGLIDAAHENLDVILLDIDLPDINGIDVLRQLRKTSDTPIIMMSARNTPSDRLAALDAGAADVLAKPFSLECLISRIRGVMTPIGKVDQSPKRRLRVGDLIVDLPERRIFRSGEEIRLSPTEANLLKMLIQHRGRLLSAHFLNEAMWGPDHSAESPDLPVLMNDLRHKIELDPIRPRYLMAEAGVGYRFTADVSDAS
jgi:two-component system KDP operon response regulator KdpE